MTLATINYVILRTTNLGFDEAIEAVTAAFAKEGFGILAEIDGQATLKKKLDIGHPKNLIPGACNPNLANNVLNAEPRAGLLLLCNIVIQEFGGVTQVAFMDPEVIRREIQNSTIADTACDAKDRLTRVSNSIPE
ncbi:MAG: DUF302 domain-containing protein [Dehalococcoidia bacterium]|nr:DUF302 domain-containing protein [Dehalococcoidia bacterium]